ncbi:MAG: hypothetical protein ACKE9I_09215 [Methylophagaceae bacterium]
MKALDSTDFDDKKAKGVYARLRIEQERVRHKEEVEKQKAIEASRPKYEFRVCPYCKIEIPITKGICTCGELMGAEPIQYKYLDE